MSTDVIEMTVGDNLSPLTAHSGLLPPNLKLIPHDNNNEIDADYDNDNNSVGTFNTVTLPIDTIELLMSMVMDLMLFKILRYR